MNPIKTIYNCKFSLLWIIVLLLFQINCFYDYDQEWSIKNKLIKQYSIEFYKQRILLEVVKWEDKKILSYLTSRRKIINYDFENNKLYIEESLKPENELKAEYVFNEYGLSKEDIEKWKYFLEEVDSYLITKDINCSGVHISRYKKSPTFLGNPVEEGWYYIPSNDNLGINNILKNRFTKIIHLEKDWYWGIDK